MPGRILTLLSLSLTILLWPGFLERVISLDWQVGNVRPVVYGLQGLFAAVAVGSLRAQRWINAFFVAEFPRKELILAIGFFFLSLGAVEIACRWLDIPFKRRWTPSETALAQFDPELGWSYIPNHSAVQQFGTERREVAMHFDNTGARVRVPGIRRDPCAPTLLLVGCSFTMGHGLFYEETMAGLLESMTAFPLQVVNLAVQGYGTDQSLLMLRRHLPRFNTKAVVYGFVCGSDDHVRRNTNYDRRLIHPQARFLSTKPMFALKSDGTLYLKRTPQKYEEFFDLHLWGLVRIAWTRYGPVPTPDVTRALVQEIRDYVSSNRATFVVLNWTTCPKDYFQGIQLNLVNGPPDWTKWRIPGDGHPDARANQYITQRLLEEFKRLGLLSQDGRG
jgi:hypothetical protein